MAYCGIWDGCIVWFCEIGLYWFVAMLWGFRVSGSTHPISQIPQYIRQISPQISHKTPFWNRYEHTCRGYPAKWALPAMLTRFWQDTLYVHIAVRRTWLRAESVVSTGLRSTQYSSVIYLVFDRSLDGLVCVRYVFSARLVLFIEGRFLFVGKLHEMTSTGTLIYGWWRAWAFMTSTEA